MGDLPRIFIRSKALVARPVPGIQYSIGTRKDDNQFEIWAGSFPTILMVLNIPGSSNRDYILKYERDVVYIVYTWKEAAGAWELVKDNQGRKKNEMGIL